MRVNTSQSNRGTLTPCLKYPLIKSHKITYKVFLFERVKKKLNFFNTETYPLQIRFTSGSKSIYLKSYLFSLLQQNKYQQDFIFQQKPVSIEHIIEREDELLKKMLAGDSPVSPEEARQQYYYLSHDLLNDLDEQFKVFLINFFLAEQLPVYASFIRSDGNNHNSEFILNSLQQSLQNEVYNKLLQSAAETAPPYIPVINFFRKKLNSVVPVLQLYQWQQQKTIQAFSTFLSRNFPAYNLQKIQMQIEEVLSPFQPSAKKQLL